MILFVLDYYVDNNTAFYKQAFEEFLNSEDILFCVASKEGFYLDYSKAFKNLLGYDDETLKSTPFIDLVHPDFREGTLEEMQSAVDKKQPVVDHINLYLSSNGEAIWFKWKSIYLKGQDIFIAFPENITNEIELEGEKNSEKEKAKVALENLKIFSKTISNVSEHIVITDSDGLILYANQAAEKLTGYSFEEMRAKKAGVKELWGGLMDQDFYNQMWHVIKEEKRPFKGVIKNQHRKGYFYFADVTITPLLNSNNEVINFIGIERDVTNHITLSKTKSKIINLISHQLRTPLSGLNWSIELLMSGDLGAVNEKQKKQLRQIENGFEEIRDIISNILNAARVEAGNIKVTPEPSNLVEIFEQILKHHQEMLIVDKVNIIKNYNGHDEKTVLVDKGLFTLIVHELLDNALDYTLGESYEVWANIFEVDIGSEAGGKVFDQRGTVFSLSDNGIGIPENEKEFIMKKFFRGLEASRIVPEGNGLGLYTANQVAELSGCELWFESQEGLGSEFFLFIPKDGMKQKHGAQIIVDKLMD